MERIWEENEYIDEDSDLTVTSHRDPVPDTEQFHAQDFHTEATADDPQEELEALGEDVASSPRERGEA